MQLLKGIFFYSFIVILAPVYAQSSLPDFSQYPLPKAEVFNETPAQVDLSSYKGARTYRTKLTEGAKEGPNFAGHYTIVSFGCGTQCQDNWLIDAKTGKILDRFSSIVGLKYQLDSLLLVINPPDPQLKKAYEEHPDQPLLGTMDTTYKAFKNGKFDIVHKEKWVNVIETLP